MTTLKTRCMWALERPRSGRAPWPGAALPALGGSGVGRAAGATRRRAAGAAWRGSPCGPLMVAGVGLRRARAGVTPRPARQHLGARRGRAAEAASLNAPS